MNQKEDRGAARGTTGPHLVLMVDDEPQACKWFARLYGGEFAVLTARGADEALALLAERGHEVAVLLTDYSMAGRDGVALLGEVRRLYPHVARLLMSAYADKDVAKSAINQGQVEKMLEKPLDDALTRQVLKESMAISKERVRQQQLVARRASALRDSSRGDTSASLLASDLVRAVEEEYPFEPGEAGWLSTDLSADFTLPGRRDLLYLVLCTLVKNALIAMRANPPAQPMLRISLARAAAAPGLPLQAALVVSNNGSGILPEVLQRPMVEPVTTRAEFGGSGMDALFCHRVLTSLSGSIEIRSMLGEGATVTLFFPSAQDTPVEETR